MTHMLSNLLWSFVALLHALEPVLYIGGSVMVTYWLLGKVRRVVRWCYEAWMATRPNPLRDAAGTLPEQVPLPWWHPKAR